MCLALAWSVPGCALPVCKRCSCCGRATSLIQVRGIEAPDAHAGRQCRRRRAIILALPANLDSCRSFARGHDSTPPLPDLMVGRQCSRSQSKIMRRTKPGDSRANRSGSPRRHAEQIGSVSALVAMGVTPAKEFGHSVQSRPCSCAPGRHAIGEPPNAHWKHRNSKGGRSRLCLRHRHEVSARRPLSAAKPPTCRKTRPCQPGRAFLPACFRCRSRHPHRCPANAWPAGRVRDPGWSAACPTADHSRRST